MIKRRETLPRSRPAPEVNIIQRPELLRRLQRFLGLRQAHIAPALNEGVQPVVVLGTLTDAPGIERGGYATAEGVATGDASNAAVCLFDNPSGSGVKARIIWFSLTPIAQAANPQFWDVRWTFGQSTAFPMLLAPDGTGGKWEDGNIASYFEGSPTTVFPGSPKFQGRPKAALYVGKASGIVNYGNLFHPRLDATVLSPQCTVQYRPANVVVYPGQQIFIAPPAVGAGNSISIEMEWFEEPVGAGEGNP